MYTWIYSVAGPWVAKRAKEEHGSYWLLFYNCWLNMAMCYICRMPPPPDVESAVRCICRHVAIAKATGIWRFPLDCLPPEARQLAEQRAHRWIAVRGQEP